MTATALPQPAQPRGWPRWLFDTLLVILFVGPIISPLFRATGLPLMADAGWLARDVLARYICPTPAHSYVLFDLPMAVCARCWGATIGLWAARLLPLATGPATPVFAWFLALPWPTRLALCAAPFLLWPLEIIGTTSGWWSPPLSVLLINGAQAGFAAGLFFCSIWPGFWEKAYGAS